MSSLLIPNPIDKPNCSLACIKISSLSNSQSWIIFLRRQRKLFNHSISVRRQMCFSSFDARSSLKQPAAAVKAVFTEDHENPAISSLYRCSEITRPNQIVLDAQAKVCTGPEQTRPLTEEETMKVLDTILKSARGELKGDDVSKAQLGAFFAAMTIRANSFPVATQWSIGERLAMNLYWPHLVKALPPDVIFIADPEGTIMGIGNLPCYVGRGTTEMRLVGALREVLAGGHLGYEEVKGLLEDILPFKDSKSHGVNESLLAAFLIGQRMNRETAPELKAYCLAFDDVLGPSPIADVRSLTHYGEPYDGNSRFFKSTLFVAAVRASYGESCLLHGVEWMPPKGGVTEGQLLKFIGANTNLSPMQAKTLLEDDEVGFAYVSQREARPSLDSPTLPQQSQVIAVFIRCSALVMHSIIGLREHIKKRPPLATSEKVQQFVRTRGKEAIVAGFYHEGYENSLLMLMRRREVHGGLVVKGEEGSLSLTTKPRSVNASKGVPVNHCAGFHLLNSSSTDGFSCKNFSMEVNAQDHGFEPTETPRTDRSVEKNIRFGLGALSGEKGPTYDRIVFNAGMVDHLLRCRGAEDVQTALQRAREAIDSGKALNRLKSFIKISHKV